MAGDVEILADMRNSTLDDHATPHLRLRVPGPRPRVGRRYGKATPGGHSSPAGLHARPWLPRLRNAVENDLFKVHYQPIVALEDGRPAHYEALVRLADQPSGSYVAPGRFLPAAERYGLISDIDRLVLNKVVALLAGRPEGPRIAINLSALSVTDPAMLVDLERALALQGVDPGRLIVEITETAAISDMACARAFCEGATALGCAIALDDFGSGFGSFQYLTRLPFDYLKIDGSFIRSLPKSPKDQLIVRALAGLARNMGMQTIAEYVTDDATVRLLRAFGVDYAQGYELGRPRPL
jgi:EAL domain-containing protein (putative c-di-GMP-specific phosphodiesterase class I)